MNQYVINQMKRKALLIGNTGGLPGVAIDLERMSTFLKSYKGGAWYQNEIITLQNPAKNTLLAQVEQLKRDYLDYCVVLYSGHGGHCHETLLAINPREETITESLLWNIAPRQLSIFDCCRVELERVVKASVMDSVDFSASAAGSIRRLYEQRIMAAIPQHIRLYACSVGQYSIDTPDGAIYLSKLLRAAGKIEHGATYKTVGIAHDEVRSQLLLSGAQQTPEAYLPKCLPQQQLILSMNI
ncbi:caspase family protein [Burkholderia sp. BCC0405]|uniref:caspase family protein n=1 Tax=Burkholderia sp. BCC0405 TaxID=2676298 RepID=UPI0015897DF5|nr:caspase family protein [Burkholderia sp. BCC0405]